MIAQEKFGPRLPASPMMNIYTNDLNLNPVLAMRIYGFATTNTIPFPSEETPGVSGKYITVPYIGFNYLGQPITGQNELIPVAKGAVVFGHDPNTGQPTGAMTVRESPPGNSSNAFNVVSIDGLTGRARLERQEVR